MVGGRLSKCLLLGEAQISIVASIAHVYGVFTMHLRQYSGCYMPSLNNLYNQSEKRLRSGKLQGHTASEELSHSGTLSLPFSRGCLLVELPVGMKLCCAPHFSSQLLLGAGGGRTSLFSGKILGRLENVQGA